MLPTKAYAVHEPQARFAPFSFERRDPRPNDVVIDILFCGVCHSDLHTACGEWGATLASPATRLSGGSPRSAAT
jgi:alcohol dehydrogenase (NADP+)